MRLSDHSAAHRSSDCAVNVDPGPDADFPLDPARAEEAVRALLVATLRADAADELDLLERLYYEDRGEEADDAASRAMGPPAWSAAVNHLRYFGGRRDARWLLLLDAAAEEARP